MAASLVGRASIRGGSETVQMVLLTFCTIGITFTWGIEMTYCTPYLLNLGLTKSNTSLVWIAGPLSGLIVQPIVGVVADESTSRWGRRRPLMLVGAVIVSASLLVLGFTREIVAALGGGDGKDAATMRATIVLAVAAIYAVDFAINAIMSCARSLVVDTLPIEKQQTGAAWGSRMNAIGHMIGYGAGSIDLVRLLGPGFGDTQFKQLTVIAAMAILGTTAVTCWAVTERVLVASKGPTKKHSDDSPFSVLRQIRSTLMTLPPRVQAICWAQFWSWIGWFPFLFYSTTWVGETYFRYDLPPGAAKSADTLGDIGRIGSAALMLYSTVSFVGAFLLPMVIRSPADDSYTHRPPRAMAGFLEKLNSAKPDLLTAWICGHLMFSASMFLAPLARSFVSATFLMCLCGIPWAIAMWAPTAFLGIEVNKLSGAQDPSVLPSSRQSSRPSSSSSSSSSGELSGIYFGILNIYTTLPQFLGTFISTIVFALLEPGKSPELHDATEEVAGGKEGTNAIAVCLFIGALSTLIAARMTHKLRKLS
ncbi:MFS general substrate transporter [Trichoderma citrinoviride]|uniref:MFS general substrate transporter n=1 Tax=Trichoderma citrinoviride TaxID=58853 RepID=A0A2T4BCP8_9HYPO|nr:MFS general substrate transporter [Trichoderma citrinoviride]PTB67110.1 MFS general substrate transporter [Trichoderma citrinoviride]